MATTSLGWVAAGIAVSTPLMTGGGSSRLNLFEVDTLAAWTVLLVGLVGPFTALVQAVYRPASRLNSLMMAMLAGGVVVAIGQVAA